MGWFDGKEKVVASGVGEFGPWIETETGSWRLTTRQYRPGERFDPDKPSNFLSVAEVTQRVNASMSPEAIEALKRAGQYTG